MPEVNPAIPQGTKGPLDDFFCHKYQVWYRMEDCVFRGKNRTFHGCVNCVQGHFNIKRLESAIRLPALLGARPAPPDHPAGSGELIPLRRIR